MSDRPILFSAPMIRAILREIEQTGTAKTQTRRVLKLPTKGEYVRPDMGGWKPTTLGGPGTFVFGRSGERVPAPEIICIWNRTTGTCVAAPYQSGMRLWVREAVRAVDDQDTYDFEIEYLADQARRKVADHDDRSSDAFGDWWSLLAYRSDDPDLTGGKRVPPIHMPRWASRLTLIVTDVRVQRLQEISEEDARTEGVEHDTDGWRDYLMPATQCRHSAKESFRTLWASSNGRKHPWDSNPWIVAVTFRPLLGNIDNIEASS